MTYSSQWAKKRVFQIFLVFGLSQFSQRSSVPYQEDENADCWSSAQNIEPFSWHPKIPAGKEKQQDPLAVSALVSSEDSASCISAGLESIPVTLCGGRSSVNIGSLPWETSAMKLISWRSYTVSWTYLSCGFFLRNISEQNNGVTAGHSFPIKKIHFNS